MFYVLNQNLTFNRVNLKRQIVTSQHELAKEIKENTRRLELLAVIRKEKKDLVKFVETQDKRIEKVEQMEVIHKEFTKGLLHCFA